MNEIVDINEQAKAAATEASTQGKFSFLDRLAGRNYPTEEVVVYLDEAAGYRIGKIEDELDAERARLKVLKGDALKETQGKIEKLESELSASIADAEGSRFVFHLEGISTEEYDKVVDAAQKEFPLEYKENRNPLTFAIERSVVPNDEREVFFRYHLQAKFIRRVVDPNGNIDDNITPDWVAQVANLLPVIGQIKLQTAIEKLRMTTDWMDRVQGEDFFPKS